METPKTDSCKKNIYNLLSQNHLRAALYELKGMAQQFGNWDIIQKIEETEKTYRFLLEYMSQGVTDPEREKMYNRLITDTYRLTDIVTDLSLYKESSTLYYSKKRNRKVSIPNMQSLLKEIDAQLEILSLNEFLEKEKQNNQKASECRERIDQLFSQLFDSIWCCFPASSAEMDSMRKILEPGTIPSHYLALIITAITLNLMQWYDEQMFMLLCQATENKDEIIRQRALVGLLLVMMQHQQRIAKSKSAETRIEALLENSTNRNDIQTIQLQFIRSRETEKIKKTFDEEILPTMIKLSPELYKKIDTDSLSDMLESFEKNPEWETFKNSNISDKLKAIFELQAEGSDVLMSAFSSLKSFSFFDVMSNWFIPFFAQNPEIQGILSKEVLPVIESSRNICNSDRYSLFLSIEHIPQKDREILLSQFEEQQSSLIQSDIINYEKSEPVSRLYIQDLYRFFKLYPQKNEFKDPFNTSLSLYKIPMLSPVFSNKANLHLIAELAFRKEFYIDALHLYTLLLENDQFKNEITTQEYVEFYQKTGFCKQIANDWDGAIEAYRHADIIKPDSVWTLKRLANCYRNSGNYEKALEFYLRVEKLRPDNISIQLTIGNCLMDNRQYEEALKYYFKVDYLSDEDNHKAWRPIAWCSFLLGKYKQAQKYYQRIINEDKPLMQDYINAGHTEWVLKQMPQAIAMYSSAAELQEDNKSFEKLMHQDSSYLIKAGIKESEINLMVDNISYTLS